MFLARFLLLFVLKLQKQNTLWSSVFSLWYSSGGNRTRALVDFVTLSFYTSDNLGTCSFLSNTPLTVSYEHTHTLLNSPEQKQWDAEERCFCNWSTHSLPDRIFSKILQLNFSFREGKTLLSFHPNIPEQTLASAVCVCQYIMTMNILKAKWSCVSAVTLRRNHCSELIHMHFI